MAKKIEITPFSDMDELIDSNIVSRVFDGSYEPPYSYEPDDEMLEALAKRYEFDMWTNQFPRES